MRAPPRTLGALRDHAEARRFARFLVVGFVNTLVGYGLYAALILAGFVPQWALGLSFALGVAWNYFTHARLVFHAGGLRRLPAYLAAYLAIYLLNAGTLAGLVAIGLAPLLAQALFLPLGALLAFVAIGAALTGRLPALRS
jgi:putative flippase GtrA